jgi:hypothetical protein
MKGANDGNAEEVPKGQCRHHAATWNFCMGSEYLGTDQTNVSVFLQQ